MKKTVISIMSFIFAISMCFSVFGLVGCGLVESGGHIHSYGQWISDDESTHTRECSCGESETQKHSFSGDICSRCGYKRQGTSDANSNGDDNASVAEYRGQVLNNRYHTVINTGNSKNDLIASYYDDNYYYYYYYLGRVDDVPLQDNVPYYHYTGNNFTKGFKKTQSDSATVENGCTEAVANTTTFSSTKSIDAGISIKVASEVEAKASSGALSASSKISSEFSASLEVGYSRTTGKTNNTSRTDSYKKVATSTETTEETTMFEFTDESKTGYYRYIMTGSVDIYTAVIYIIKDKEYILKTLTEVKAFGYSFDYSESSRFDDNNCGKLEFDYSILVANPERPSTPLSEANTILPPNETEMGDVINYAGGAGTKESPYLISTAKHLQNIALNRDKYFKILNNIDLSDKRWEPIISFSGELDGNNKSINKLTFYEDKNATTDEIFGFIRTLTGTVKNITFNDSTIHTWKYHDHRSPVVLYMGTVCGILSGGTISSVTINNGNVYGYNDTDIKDIKTHAFVGGIAGQISSGTISNCEIVGNTTIEGITRINYNTDSKADCWSYVGGIVGKMTGGEVFSCGRSDSVNVIAHTHSGSKTSAYHSICGGIIGYQEGGEQFLNSSTSTNLVNNCEVEGNRKANTSEAKKNNIVGNK